MEAIKRSVINTLYCITMKKPEITNPCLRADVSKNQTLAGNSQKIDFAHTFKFDTLSC